MISWILSLPSVRRLGLWIGVNGTLNLTRVGLDRQLGTDPPVVLAVVPARGNNGGQTFSSSFALSLPACGRAMMPARRLSLSR